MIAAPPGHEAEVAAGAPEGIEVEVVTGAGARSQSVAAALARAGTELVAVHDAARPLVEPGLINALVARLEADRAAAGIVAATPLTDTVKRTGDDRVVERTEDRERLWVAQTPQVFRAAAVRDAYAAAGERIATATDDSMLVEEAGGRVLVEPAPAQNLKVTTPADLRIAELLLGERPG